MNIKQVEREVKSYFGDEIQQIEGQEVGGSQILFDVQLPYPDDLDDLQVYVNQTHGVASVISLVQDAILRFRE
jgi:hypothetical protein